MTANRRKTSLSATFITAPPAQGEVRGYELPEGILPVAWHPMTVKWWNTWRTSAQSGAFLDTDWDFLLDTALMHHVMWDKQRWEFANEIRMRVAKFGATPKDRLDLRMEQDPRGVAADRDLPASQQRGVVSLADRRKAITGA